MIKIPHQRRSFPHPMQDHCPVNSWGNQWQHLPRRALRVVRVGHALRVMPLG